MAPHAVPITLHLRWRRQPHEGTHVWAGIPTPPPGAKHARDAIEPVVGAYHQEQLRILLEHVRDGFVQLDAGEIDEFELDDIIHRYKRAARKLCSFCGSSGSQWLQAATALEYIRDRGEEHDWWAESERHQDRLVARSDVSRFVIQ